MTLCLPAWRFPDGRVRAPSLPSRAFGACPAVMFPSSSGRGLGYFDENLTLKKELSRLESGISSNYYMSMMRQFCEQKGFRWIFL